MASGVWSYTLPTRVRIISELIIKIVKIKWYIYVGRYSAFKTVKIQALALDVLSTAGQSLNECPESPVKAEY